MIFIYFKVQCTFSNLSSLAWLPVDHILRNSLMSACRRLSVQCWLCSRSTIQIIHSIKKDFPHQLSMSMFFLNFKMIFIYFKVQCTFSNLSSLAWLPVDHILRNSLMSTCRRLSVTCWLCSRSIVHIKLSIKKNFPHQPGIISIILEVIELVLLYFLMFPQWFHNISLKHFLIHNISFYRMKLISCVKIF